MLEVRSLMIDSRQRPRGRRTKMLHGVTPCYIREIDDPIKPRSGRELRIGGAGSVTRLEPMPPGTNVGAMHGNASRCNLATAGKIARFRAQREIRI
jgi:hypothetical protein